MLRIGSIALTLGLTATLLAACDSDDEPKSGTTYVALGDSYVAAPNIGDRDDDNGCLRSKNNYPHLLAEKLDLALTDVSCSGATTDAIEGEQQLRGGGVDPQIEAVDDDTQLVTLGVGFNDLGLTIRVFVQCVSLARRDPDGSPCTDADRAAGAKGTQNALDQMDDRIGAVVETVAQRAPEAQIVLVGYPTIFPTTDTCAELNIAAGDLPLVRHVVESLNASAERVARKHDATYVDTATPSKGHDICSDDPWIAGTAPASGRRGLAWHPYTEEQEMVADLLADVVDR